MVKANKEVTLQDKIEERHLEDELYKESTGRSEETGEFIKPKILAIINSTRKSKLMLLECKNRGVEFENVITEEKFHEQPMKVIPKIIKAELEKENKYHVLYLPISNTDFNKNPNEWNELRGHLQHKLELNVNFYFDGHDDQEISNRVFSHGI